MSKLPPVHAMLHWRVGSLLPLAAGLLISPNDANASSTAAVTPEVSKARLSDARAPCCCCILLGFHNPREGQASQAVYAMGVPSSFCAKESSPQLSPLLRNKTRQNESLPGTFLPSKVLHNCIRLVENNWLL